MNEKERHILDKLLQVASTSREIPSHSLLQPDVCPLITIQCQWFKYTNLISWIKGLANENKMNLLAIPTAEWASLSLALQRRHMKAAFKLARIHDPCIIFFDTGEDLHGHEQHTAGDGQRGCLWSLQNQLVREIDQSTKNHIKPVVLLEIKAPKPSLVAIQNYQLLHV